MTLLAMNWGNALIVTFIGFGIVFLILCLLIGIITLFGKIMAPKVSVKKTISVGNDSSAVSETILSGVHIPALDSAAIATALHLYYDDVHDEESHIITIKNVERRYSPWNSKIYGINNAINR